MLIGATPEGRKELVGFTDGARESAHDWRDLLLDLKRRGLDASPRPVIADGALGFWKAAGEIWPKTREQRCWVHKTANVLAKFSKSQQPKAIAQAHVKTDKIDVRCMRFSCASAPGRRRLNAMIRRDSSIAKFGPRNWAISSIATRCMARGIARRAPMAATREHAPR